MYGRFYKPQFMLYFAKNLHKGCEFANFATLMRETLFIDIGSNTIKALLASFKDGKVAPLGEFSLPNRISAPNGLREDAANVITSSVLELGLMAKQKFNSDFETVCFGTSALRESANAKEISHQLVLRGICVRVLSGKDEAMLSFKGAMGDDALKGMSLANVLYGDLGGGSMEFVSKSGNDKTYLSLPLGAVRLTNMFSKETNLDIPNLKKFCQKTLSEIQIPLGDFTFAISGGAISAARHILGGGQLSACDSVSKADLTYCLNEALSLGADGLSQKYSTPKNRADILPAAFVCLIEVLNYAKRDEFIHIRRSLRYGVAELYYGI